MRNLKKLRQYENFHFFEKLKFGNKILGKLLLRKISRGKLDQKQEWRDPF